MKKSAVAAFKIGFAIAFAFVLAVSQVSPVFANDFGGRFTNDSALQTYSDGKFNIDQKNSISLWARENFDKAGDNFFAVEGSYNFEGDFDAEESERYTNALDIDLFALNLLQPLGAGKIGATAGRFYFSDLTGLIFTQNADGAKISYQNNYFALSAYGAYTGLLNALNVKFISENPEQFAARGKMPALQNSMGLYAADNDKVYDFAEKYAVAQMSLAFPYFWANQTFTAEFLGAFHLEDEKYNRMYATAGFEGPVAGSVFYRATTTLGFLSYEKTGTDGGKESESEISNLTKISLNYYFGKASLGLAGVYASGNQGPFSPFIGFTKNTSTYSLQDFLYTGIIKTQANASYKPLDNLLLSADCGVVFNALAGDDEDSAEGSGGFDKIEYYGFEYSLGAVWQVKSDLQLGATAMQFFDKDNSDMFKKTYLSLHVALAF